MKVNSSNNITTERDFAYVDEVFGAVRMGAPFGFILLFYMNDDTLISIGVWNANKASYNGVACTPEDACRRYIKLVNEKNYKCLIYQAIVW